jgi:hypothetical protein
VNASRHEGEFDVWLEGEGTPLLAGVDFAEASPYFELPPGDAVFAFRPSGAGIGSPAFFTSEVVPLSEGSQITAVATGESEASGPAAFQLLAFEDGFSGPGDEPRARFVHLSNDLGNLSIDIDGDGVPEEDDIPRFSATAATGMALSALEPTRLHLLTSGAEVTSFTLDAAPAGEDVYLLATGLIEDLPRLDSSLAVIVVPSESSTDILRQDPTLHILHGSADIGEIDICLDGSPLVADLDFAELRSIQVAPANNYDLDIHDSVGVPCSGPLVFDADTEAVARGTQHLVGLAGEQDPESGESGLTIAIAEETFGLDAPASDATVRVMNAGSHTMRTLGTIPGSTATQLQAADHWLNNVSPGLYSNNDRLITQDSVRLGIGEAGDNRPPYDLAGRFAPVDTPDGMRGWLVTIGDLTPAGQEAEQRVLSVTTGPLAEDWAILDSAPATAL